MSQTAITSPLSFLQRLIAFPTVSHVSNGEITDFVADFLTQSGFGVEVSTYQDVNGVAKKNLVACRTPLGTPRTTGGVGLAYFAHTDVVPAERWTGPGGDPFTAVIAQDRVYGRGACDMKGSLATMLSAIQQTDAREQTAPLWVACTADEETGLDGARWLTQHSHAYRALASQNPLAVIGEPTRLDVVHAHKGMCSLRLRSTGKAAHSSTGQGSNASAAMVPMLQVLLEIDHRCRNDLTLRNPDFDPPTLTWNFGFSDHATAHNIVPDQCIAWASFRMMPDVDSDPLIQQVRQAATELGIQLQVQLSCEPCVTPPDDAHVVSLCELAASHGASSRPTTACYATDAGVLSDLTHRVICGPGDIAQAHTTDEFITFQQLHAGVELYRQAITRWCGGAPA